MTINTFVYPLALVSLPIANCFELSFNKHDYTTVVNDCQYHNNASQPKIKNTMEYNTITNKELIEINNMKFQDIIPPD